MGSKINLLLSTFYLVLNGSGVNGLAGTLKEDMESIGYSEIEVGNAESQDESIIISNNKEVREQLKLDVGITNVDKDKNDYYSDYDAVIIIGKENNIKVSSFRHFFLYKK